MQPIKILICNTNNLGTGGWPSAVAGSEQSQSSATAEEKGTPEVEEGEMADMAGGFPLETIPEEDTGNILNLFGSEKGALGDIRCKLPKTFAAVLIAKCKNAFRDQRLHNV